jgi:hypothetical protein
MIFLIVFSFGAAANITYQDVHRQLDPTAGRKKLDSPCYAACPIPPTAEPIRPGGQVEID